MSSSNSGNRVRLRISEIQIQPPVSERAIKAKLLVDGAFIKEFPTVEKGQPLKWSSLTIVDANQNSRIELEVYERHYRKHSRHNSELCLVSEMEGTSTRVLKIQDTQYSAELKIFDQAQAEELFTKSRDKLTEIGQVNNANEKLKKAQRMFKSMLEFGSAVAEFNPIAKMVFAVCTRAWERVEEQQKSSEELDDLAGRLIGMAPLVDEVKKHARLEPLRQNIEEFLCMIEDVSIFVLERKTKGFVVQVFRSVFDSSDKDRVEELVKRFQKTKDDFDTAIGVQTLAMVATADERELLKQLNPVEPSGHDPSRACQDGTRLGVLGYIDNWITDQNPSSTFMWIYGQAGIGKSTILTSVCNRLSDRSIPIVSFFCKRDDPALRDPLRLINSIVYGLACRYPPYGKRLAKAIQTNPELSTSHLRVRYEGLLKKPLSELAGVSPPPHFILIDAMDECGADESRQQVLGSIWELTQLIPWLRFIVTSRPDSDIRNLFNHCDKSTISRCDIQSYPAAGDIRVFIEATVSDVATRDEWPTDGIDRLCAKAGGLFIWAATACKFVIKADDTQDRLRQLVEENASAGGFDGLDSLYAAVIRNSMTDQATDSILNMRRSIGAIVTISMKQPVPIEVLCKIMQPHMKPGVLKTVVGRLGAVLYSDAQLAGAIRVLHPSFADFALDQSRSSGFWVDPIQRNIELSIGCFFTMEQELKFNICELETSHLLNSEVPDLESKIEASISGQLAYSCVYWISHLVECDDETLAGRVATIVDTPRLLYWLEVLSVLQRVDVALEGLLELSRRLTSYQQKIAHHVWDAYRFVFAFSDPISASAPHIYISALPLAPKQSEVFRRLSPLFPHAAVVEGGDQAWPQWLRTISLPARLCSLYVSRDSQRLATLTSNESSRESTISIFNLRTASLLKTLKYSFSEKPDFVGISTEGSLITSGSAVGGILFWDADTGTVIHSVQIPGSKGKIGIKQIRAWTFSLDGNVLRLLIQTVAPILEVSQDNKITLWEIEPRKAVMTSLFQLNTGARTAVSFSSNGNHFAVGSNGHLVMYSLSNATVAIQFNQKLSHTPDVIVFLPNGDLVATVSYFRGTGVHIWDMGVHIWDTKTGASIGAFKQQISLFSPHAFSPDGAQMGILETKRTDTNNSIFTMKIWDIRTRTVISMFDVYAKNQHIRNFWFFFSPDNAHVFTGFPNDTKLQVWDASSSNLSISNYADGVYTPGPMYSNHSDKIGSILFSLCGTYIISGSNDSAVRTWDARTGVPIDEPLSVNGPVRQIALSPDGNRVMASTEQDNKLYIWDFKKTGYGQPCIRDEIYSFALSPDGNHLVTGGAPSSDMIVWDINTGNKIKELRVDLHFVQSPPKFLAFSFDGSHMFSYHSCISSLTPNFSQEIPDEGGADPQDNDSLVSAPEEVGLVHIWDPKTYGLVGFWRVTGSLHTHQSHVQAVSPNATYLAISHLSVGTFDHDITSIHDAHTGKIITTFPNDVLLSGPNFRGLSCVTFSPDGTMVVSGYQMGIIWLWHAASGIIMGHYVFSDETGSPDPVRSISFSLDGAKLVAGSRRGNIYVLDMCRFDTGAANHWDWGNGDTSNWPSNTSRFLPHPVHSGWVSHDQISPTIWLPDHYRRGYEPELLLRISKKPMVHIDFTKFVHGTEWTSVISEEALHSYR